MPLNVAFFNPDLVGQIRLGPLLQGIGLEAEYKQRRADRQPAPQCAVPDPGRRTTRSAWTAPTLPECFNGVVDLGALDVERGRDHGMPSYNELRQAYGLAPKQSFTDITGESTEAFPADPELTPGDEINDPDSLDFARALRPWPATRSRSTARRPRARPSPAVRRTTLAARLKAVYGSVDKVDAFTGMVAEAHVRGTEFGELQLAIWKQAVPGAARRRPLLLPATTPG